MKLARPGQSRPADSLGRLRHQLGTVVGQTRQQVGPAPAEEVVQRDTWVSAHLDLVVLGPSLQAHQRHTHVQGPEELRKSRGSGQGFPWPREGAVRVPLSPTLTVSRRRATSSVRFSRCCKSGYRWTCGLRGGREGRRGRRGQGRTRRARRAHLRVVSHNYQLHSLGLCQHIPPPL